MIRHPVQRQPGHDQRDEVDADRRPVAVLVRLGFTEDSWAEQIKAVTKHGAEVAGWMLVALALGSVPRR